RAAADQPASVPLLVARLDRAGLEAVESGSQEVTTPRAPWYVVAPAVVVVALAAAGFAIAFRSSLAAITGLLGARNVAARLEGPPWWLRLVLPAAGGLGAGLIGLAIAHQRGSGGVGYVMEAIVLGRVRVPLVRSSLQALAAWLAIAGGNSLGREGPLIQ